MHPPISCTVHWVLFVEDDVEGLYASKKKHILLDCILMQSYSRRFHCIAHELVHHFTVWLPCWLEKLIDTAIDMTDGNDPTKLHVKRDPTVVLFVW
jgi:hypothetical protein